MKTLLLRLGLMIPVALFGVYVLMVMIGCVASAFGAQDIFYCGVYAKLAVAITVVAATLTVYCQTRACLRKDY